MIGIVFCGDIKYCPYLNRYTDLMNNNSISYEVLFWNRSGFDISMPDNYIYYEHHSSLSNGKTKKLLDFFMFRNWLKKCLKKKKYDKIIVLTTLTGIVIWDVLKSYQGKYIFDIRDYSYEHNKLFYKLEKNIIYNSAFTAISSPGFKSFLPDFDKYVIAHNINPDELSFNNSANISALSKINLVWNGTLRYFEHQRKLLDLLKNDERFSIIYHGDGSDFEKYKAYCKENQISNVVFTGLYDNSQKCMLLENASVLNNSYGLGRHDNDQVKYAISNRYYDGLNYHIPQLVEYGTYKAKLVEENQVGIALEFTPDFGDRLYEYYSNIDITQFDNSCNTLIKTVVEEDKIYTKNIIDFVTSV